MLVYNVDFVAVEKFVAKYPKAGEAIKAYVKGCSNETIMKAYCKWLDLADEAMHSEAWGAAGKTVGSPSFGTKTFYKYEWSGCSGWAQVFSYYWEVA